MPHKRPVKKGSFGAHFDELVKHFPHRARQAEPALSSHEPAGANIKERLDIHALLFERAWRLEQEQERGI
jgi:hypothetical protein